MSARLVNGILHSPPNHLMHRACWGLALCCVLQMTSYGFRAMGMVTQDMTRMSEKENIAGMRRPTGNTKETT